MARRATKIVATLGPASSDPALLEQMISQQRAKVLRLAREAVPHIGPEDVLNPHDFPELKAHPTFEFEDGLLSGLVAAQVALRAERRRQAEP